tara:strand:+ start:245 stop:355 length:111 start_codon:yes stop_codon:yes gene_type:complete
MSLTILDLASSPDCDNPSGVVDIGDVCGWGIIRVKI